MTLGDAVSTKFPMKMFIGSSPKQRRYLSPITRLRPAVGVNIAAKDATNEIDLTKHFVVPRRKPNGAGLRQANFSKKLLKRGVIPPAQCAKPSKKGPPQRRQGEYVVERIIPRTAP